MQTLFHYYLPMEKGVALNSNKLKSLPPMDDICYDWLALAQSFNRSWKCKRFSDDRQWMIRKTWAFSPGEQKIKYSADFLTRTDKFFNLYTCMCENGIYSLYISVFDLHIDQIIYWYSFVKIIKIKIRKFYLRQYNNQNIISWKKNYNVIFIKKFSYLFQTKQISMTYMIVGWNVLTLYKMLLNT